MEEELRKQAVQRHFAGESPKWEIQKLGLPFHSDSTINRTLKREGLVKKNSIFPQRG